MALRDDTIAWATVQSTLEACDFTEVSVSSRFSFLAADKIPFSCANKLLIRRC